MPERGERAPVVYTDTVVAAGGDVEAIDTRRPTDDMHELSLREVLGKKPVALLFAAPQLCQSQVCGPWWLSPPSSIRSTATASSSSTRRSTSTTSPTGACASRRRGTGWRPFVIGRDGRVAARLEGSSGLDAFEKAVIAGIARC